jgi:hypothetical protein
MTILQLQRRLAEVGRIRIGQQVNGNGKMRPEKLDTFRLTSSDKVKIDYAAALYGGEVQPWQAPAGPQWEVITQTAALDVIVPPSDMAFSQHFELWSAGGCQRRCDGRTESITQGGCLCDPDDRDCDIHTRLSVMLRDLPGLGVWRLDTSGYNAAVELQGAVQVIQLAAGKGHMLPARLRLEQRMVKRQVDGKPQTRRFVVPVLDVEVSPGQLIAGTVESRVDLTTGEIETGPRELPGRDGRTHLTPVPAALPQWPTLSIAEQAAQVDQEPRRPTRSNAAQPLPATGLKPRTAQQAAADQPQPQEQPPPPRAQSTGQLKKMQILFKERGIEGHDARTQFAGTAIGRELKSTADMTYDETGTVIDYLERGPQQQTISDPA